MSSEIPGIPEQPGLETVPRDVLLPPQASTTDVFLECIEPLMESYARALSDLRDAIRNGLDEDTIRAAETVDYPSMETGGREQRRRDNSYLKACRSDVVYAIACAKNDAQLMVMEQDPAVQQEILATHAARTFELGEASMSSESDKHFARTWIAVFEAECAKVRAEEAFCAATLELVKDRPENLLDLLGELANGERETDDYRPLLQYLARQHFDPFEHSFVDATVDVLSSRPERYEDEFLAELDEFLKKSPTERAETLGSIDAGVLEWLHYIHITILDDGEQMTPTKLFGTNSHSVWPAPLREMLVEVYADKLRTARQQAGILLEEFKDPSLFYITGEQFAKIKSDYNMATRAVAPKKKRQGRPGGGRVTTAARAETFAESKVASAPQVHKIGVAKATPDGRLIPECVDVDDQNTEQLQDVILGLKPVQDYLSEISSDPRIESDLLAMFASIIETPRFAGAAKLINAQVTIINDEGHGVKHPIWHLNPKRRPGLSIGSVADQTRIYYVLLKDQAGKTVLGLLNVAHKNSAEKLRGHFRQT